MSTYYAAMAEMLFGPDPDSGAYAWRITRDHFAESWPDESSAVGTTGPSQAPEELLDRLEGNPRAGHTFTLWDDDGERMLTGRAVWLSGHGPADSETVAVGPLLDIGRGYGCTRITWYARPEWTCEA